MQNTRSTCRAPWGVSAVAWALLGVGAAVAVAQDGPADSEAQPPTSQRTSDADLMTAEVPGVTVDEKLGDIAPLDLPFVDEHGQRVTLRDYLREGRPVILTLNYYRCPMLCTLVLNGAANAIREVDLVPGEDYQIVTVSIDPAETPSLARMKEDAYVEFVEGDVDPARLREGWAFLTGEKQNIDALAAAVGYGYAWVESEKQYAHPAVITLLSPEGKITRYLYGIQFDPKTLRLSLVEASEGKIGSTLDRFLLTCFHFDPDTGRYSRMAVGVMRLGAGLTVGVIAVALGGLLFWEHNRRRVGVVESHE